MKAKKLFFKECHLAGRQYHDADEVWDELHVGTCLELKLDLDRIREMIARCQWTFAKTMPWAPHEYIVRGKCPLTEEEFLYFIDMQRGFGVHEHWGNLSLYR